MKHFISERELTSFLEKSKTVKDVTPVIPAKNAEPLKSVLLDPVSRYMYSGQHRTVEQNKAITYKILRHVAEKCFIINIIINHQIEGIKPFLKLSDKDSIRGFQIRPKYLDGDMTEADKKIEKKYADFFLHTGYVDDPLREDDLDHFVAKVLRDKDVLDQVTTELQRTRDGNLCAFWDIDPATVIKVEDKDVDIGNPDAVRYIQQIDFVPVAYYTRGDMIFDYETPRSDIEHAGYGYSKTEQAIDLVVGEINTFMYNMGFFTEDKLPRGLLLLQGDCDLDEVNLIEDYLVNSMSGSPMDKWHVPIIPSGSSDGGDGSRKFEWVPLQGNNKDMEYGEFTNKIWASVGALYNQDLEELGIRTSQNTSALGQNIAPRMEAVRTAWLSSNLAFLEKHFNKILAQLDPDWEFKFVGYEKDDETKQNEILKGRLETTDTVDEIRIEQGKKPFNQPWSQIPLNDKIVQLKSQESQSAMGAGGDDGNNPFGGFEGDEGSENDSNDEKTDSGSEEPSDGSDQTEKSLPGNNILEFTV